MDADGSLLGTGTPAWFEGSNLGPDAVFSAAMNAFVLTL